MTQFAAHDDFSIYAIGGSAEDAIAKARRETNPLYEFRTSNIADDFAKWIDEHGWDGNNRSFDVRDGFLVDTTEE